MADTQTTVVIDGDGLPRGFLEPALDRRTIEFEVTEDGIGVIRLNRPEKLNAFDERLIREMRTVIWKANFDDKVRVLVITSTRTLSSKFAFQITVRISRIRRSSKALSFSGRFSLMTPMPSSVTSNSMVRRSSAGSRKPRGSPSPSMTTVVCVSAIT